MLRYSGNRWICTRRGSNRNGIVKVSIFLMLFILLSAQTPEDTISEITEKHTPESIQDSINTDTLNSDTTIKDTSADTTDQDSLVPDSADTDTFNSNPDSISKNEVDSIASYIQSISEDTPTDLYKDTIKMTDKQEKQPPENKTGFMEYMNSRLTSLYLLIKPILIVIIVFIAIGLPLTGLYLLIKRRGESKKFLTTTRLSIMDKQIQRACKYIEKNYTDSQLNSEEISKGLIIGKSFLENLFRKELGMEVQDFINQVRINRALIIIDDSPGADNQRIGFECGFPSEQEFREVFKRVTRVSVDEYRESKNKQDLR